MQETLTLNDGTILDGNVIESDERLYVYLNHTTLTEAFEDLNDPEKTVVIAATQYGEDRTYRGYNHLMAISEEDRGMVSGVLRRVVTENV